MLGVLVYGYLTGQFESDEIVSGCYADPVLRELSSGIAPASRDLKSFRREHSGFIRNALAHLLRRIVDFRFGDTTRGTDLRRALLDLASERLEVARHMDRGMIWD